MLLARQGFQAAQSPALPESAGLHSSLVERTKWIIRKELLIWPQLDINIDSPAKVFQRGAGQTLSSEYPLIQVMTPQRVFSST